MILGLVVGTAGPGSGQGVDGVILDDVEGRPLAGVRVVLVDSAGAEVGRALSDSRGAFRLEVRRQGRFVLRATRLGYAPLRSPLLNVGLDTVRVELRMQPLPLTLEPVRVEAEARRLALERSGFYARRSLGIGRFMTGDDVDAGDDRMSEVLRREPSVDVVIDPMSPTGTGSRVLFRGARRGLGPGGGHYCYPTLVLDGVRVRSSGSGGIALDELVRPAELAGVELYPSGAGAPPQWAGLSAGCGLILLWTSRRP